MIRPLSDKVVVIPEERIGESPGGIVIPDIAKDRPTKGRVLAVGPGRLLDKDGTIELGPMQVSVGDVVMFTQYAGHEITLKGQEVRIIDESNILAVLESKEE